MRLEAARHAGERPALQVRRQRTNCRYVAPALCQRSALVDVAARLAVAGRENHWLSGGVPITSSSRERHRRLPPRWPTIARGGLLESERTPDCPASTRRDALLVDTV
jgi:hypothetical protein